jgi:hypothetical protein
LASVISTSVTVGGNIALLAVNGVAPPIVNFGGLAGLLLFIFFLREIALYLGRDDLMNRARNVLIVGVVCAVVFACFVFLLPAIGPSGGDAVFAVIWLSAIIVAIVLLVMYANLINAMRKAVRGEEREIRPMLFVE